MGVVHVAFAVIAMAAGGIVFLISKGTQLHRALGYVYVVSMLGLNVTALMIYRLFGGFSVFHYLALFSLLTVAAGFVPAYTKRPPGLWLVRHYRAMSWSYVGLLAAAVAESAVRLPFLRGTWWHFWLTVIGGSFVVAFVGGYLIATREASTMAKLRQPPAEPAPVPENAA
jgi:uncharacterized membrane protein